LRPCEIVVLGFLKVTDSSVVTLAVEGLQVMLGEASIVGPAAELSPAKTIVEAKPRMTPRISELLITLIPYPPLTEKSHPP
jgi:hypothetical protein